ncbi:MAG: hypothetical protein AB7U05_17250 [Mangrovibacterium sp.]
MRKRKPRVAPNPKRENRNLSRERFALQMLTEAMNETRAEDELARMLKHSFISNR